MWTQGKMTITSIVLLLLFFGIDTLNAQYVAEANLAYSKGIALIKRGKNSKSIYQFRKVLKEEPNHDAACLLLIKLYLEKNNNDQANYYINHLSKIQVTSKRRNIEKSYYLAFGKIIKGEYANARLMIEDVITKAHQNNNLDFNLLARSYNVLGYLDVMENQLESDNDKRVVVNERNLRNARFLFEEALKYKPSSPIAATNYNRVNTALRTPPNKIVPYQTDEFQYDTQLPTNRVKQNVQHYDMTLSFRQEWLPAKVHWVMEDFSNYDELVFMMDASGSMRVPAEMNPSISRFDWMKNLAYYMLRNVSTNTSLGVVAVGGECGEQPPLQLATNTSRGDIARQVKALKADGHTPVNQAISIADQLFKKRGKKKAILFITDGMESCEPGLTCELSAQLGQLGIELHILSFLDQAKAQNEYISYTCMVESSGGTLKGINESGEVEQRDYQYNIEEPLIIPLLKKKEAGTERVVMLTD